MIDASHSASDGSLIHEVHFRHRIGYVLEATKNQVLLQLVRTGSHNNLIVWQQ